MNRILKPDPASWQYRNMMMRRGELCARPGLREVKDFAAAAVACKSVRVPETGETWHYVVYASGTIGVYDDNFATLFTHIATTANVRTASFAVQADTISISSPDFPTQHGLLGSGLERMRVKDSVNPLTTAIAPPHGVCVAWANRVVIAEDAFIYISDPQEPRTYVPQNISRIPTGSPVYGLHVSADGALVAVCSTGVWALPEDAPTIGQEALQIWSKLNDHVFLDYDTSCVSRGTVWGLSQNGVRQLFPQQGKELEIGLDSSGTNVGTSADELFPDMREGRLIGTQAGLMVGIRDVSFVLDMQTGFGSWWSRRSDEFEVVGLLEDSRGEELYLTRAGTVCRAIGNCDGGIAISTLTATQAELIVPLDIELESDVVRMAKWKTDGEDGSSARAPGGAGADGDGAFSSDSLVLIESATTFASTTAFKTPTPIVRRSFFEARVHGGHVTMQIKGGTAKVGPEVEIETVTTKRAAV